MNEHDDDLESSVHDDAAEETETFPDTADELIDTADEAGEDGEDPELDEDETEL